MTQSRNFFKKRKTDSEVEFKFLGKISEKFLSVSVTEGKKVHDY